MTADATPGGRPVPLGTRRLDCSLNNPRKLRPEKLLGPTIFVRALADIGKTTHVVSPISYSSNRARVPLGTRKLEFARQLATTALRGRRPQRTSLNQENHNKSPEWGPRRDRRYFVSLGPSGCKNSLCPRAGGAARHSGGPIRKQKQPCQIPECKCGSEARSYRYATRGGSTVGSHPASCETDRLKILDRFSFQQVAGGHPVENLSELLLSFCA